MASGALLSAVFNVLLDKFTPAVPDLVKLFIQKNLENPLLHLKPCLISANAVLKDAEFKRFTDPYVKDWYDELSDAAYDLEDLTGDACLNQVCNSLSAPLLCSKIKQAIDRIDGLVSRKGDLGLTGGSGLDTLSWRPQVTPWAKVPDVCGREREKEDIMKLLSAADDDDKLSIIPIVGLGGVGKTTLAQLVYDDGNFNKKFHCRAWATVSENFDLLKILQTILNKLDPESVSEKVEDPDILQSRLRKNLEGKKFFIVLDDVWTTKYTNWEALENLLSNGVKGCKILVTTRQEHVASMVQTLPPFYRLGLMSDEDCFSIFTRHAFRHRNSCMDSCLEKIGRDVASKCKGLPLAAKVLGGLFRSMPDIKHWNSMLKDNTLWDFDSDIIPALRVSYYYLPPHLKRCFVYCSLFPDDHQFCKESLILMWKGEGFLQPERNMSSEEVGYRYFNELTSISFFQASHEEDDKYFVMHDLIHELATRAAGDLYLRLEKNGDKIGSKTRHLSCNFSKYPSLDVEFFEKAEALRTFIGLNWYSLPRSIKSVPHIPLFKLKYLRTLSLFGLSSLTRVPSSIGECTQLHYLDLSITSIVNLPDSLCELSNLQTLMLCFCFKLKSLPSNTERLVNLCHLDVHATRIERFPDSFCKLVNLRTLKVGYCRYLELLPCDMHDLVNLQHLDIRGTPLKQMPRGLGKLTDLQFLSDFIVGTEQEVMIEELGEISNLEGELKISNIENIRDGIEASKARMMEKKGLEDLKFSWSGYDSMKDSETEKVILENLQPHLDLASLEIDGYKGVVFPDWLGHHSYHNMTSLMLFGCKYCWRLPPLGQLPALKSLYIRELKMVQIISNEFLNGNDFASITPFASLEFLDFRMMGSWEQWQLDDVEAFPKLKHLQLIDCDKLAGNLPCQLRSLETLEINRCSLLRSCIPTSPKLWYLVITASPNVVWQGQEFPPSLQLLEISGDQMLELMLEALYTNLQIEYLSFNDCSNMSLQTTVLNLPLSLKHLSIGNCENINFVMCSIAPLQDLQLISIINCQSLKFSGLVPNFKELHINEYNGMEEFPQGILVSSLMALHIQFSHKLVSSHAQWQLPRITNLSITCSSSKCFPEVSSLPATLTTLELCDIGSLETIDCEALQHLTSLQQLKISHCTKLNQISGKLPKSVKLHIEGCPLLEERLHNRDEEIMAIVGDLSFISLDGDPLQSTRIKTKMIL